MDKLKKIQRSLVKWYPVLNNGADYFIDVPNHFLVICSILVPAVGGGLLSDSAAIYMGVGVKEFQFKADYITSPDAYSVKVNMFSNTTWDDSCLHKGRLLVKNKNQYVQVMEFWDVEV